MKKRQTTRPRFRVLTGVIGASALLASACGSGEAAVDTAAAPATDTASTDTGSVSTSAPDTGAESSPGVFGLTASTVDGSQLDFGSFEGKDAVLWFWAPW